MRSYTRYRELRPRSLFACGNHADALPDFPISLHIVRKARLRVLVSQDGTLAGARSSARGAALSCVTDSAKPALLFLSEPCPDPACICESLCRLSAHHLNVCLETQRQVG